VTIAPHLGQAVAELVAWLTPPMWCLPTVRDGSDGDLLEMCLPHTSQKSSLAESWPDGQVAIAIPS
jgi:hypothetical protein